MRGVSLACGILAGFLLASPARADISLTIDDGRVTLVAKEATLAQIMVEWARVGRTKVINGERLTGPPITLELNSVPEETALGIILRSASGYLVAPRERSVEHASRFDRILIMPTSVAPRPTPTQAPAVAPQTFPQPSFGEPPFPQPASTQPQPPQFGAPPAPQFGAPPTPAEQQPDTDLPPQTPFQPGTNPRGPVFQTFPVTQPFQQQPAPQPGSPTAVPLTPPQGVAPPPGASPTVPPGVSVPGMLVPAPPNQQPGQPSPQPSAPQPERRPRN